MVEFIQTIYGHWWMVRQVHIGGWWKGIVVLQSGVTYGLRLRR